MNTTAKHMLKWSAAIVASAVALCAVALVGIHVFLSYTFPELQGPETEGVYALTPKHGTTIKLRDLVANKKARRACIVPSGEAISKVVGDAAFRSLRLNTDVDVVSWLIFSEENGRSRIELVAAGDIGLKHDDGFCTYSLDINATIVPCDHCRRGFALSFEKPAK